MGLQKSQRQRIHIRMRRRGFLFNFSVFSIAFAFLFHASPCLGRILGVVLLAVNDANAANLVIVGPACFQVLRVQILRCTSVLRRKECFRAVGTVLLYGTVDFKTVNLVAFRFRPCQKHLSVLRQFGLQNDGCVLNTLDKFRLLVCARVRRVR